LKTPSPPGQISQANGTHSEFFSLFWGGGGDKDKIWAIKAKIAMALQVEPESHWFKMPYEKINLES